MSTTKTTPTLPPVAHGPRPVPASLAEANATPVLRLDLIIARLSMWSDGNQPHRMKARECIDVLLRLRRDVVDRQARINPPRPAPTPLVRLGPGGDFVRDIDG